MYIDKMTNYALTGKIYVPETEEEIHEYVSYLTENAISCVDDNIREEITLNLIAAKSIPGKHGWDGKLGTNMIEVKNETQSADPTSRFNGSGMFNNLSWGSFEKYKQKGIYLQGGYTRQGRLKYCIAFDIKHLLPKMEQALLKVDPSGTGGTSVSASVSVTVADYPKEVEVVYMDRNLDFTEYSMKLFNILTKNWCDRTTVRSTRLAPLSLSIDN